MTFIYKDNRGTAYLFSGNTLKRDLLFLQNKNEDLLSRVLLQDDDLNTGDVTDTNNLKGLYSKLNFEVIEISNNDLIAKFSQELSPENLELFSSIFSLNKIHFRAVVYLLYTNAINISYIKVLLDADNFTRNKLLLSEFFESETNTSLISKLTNIIIPTYFSNNNQFESMRINESKNFSIIDASVSLYPEQYYLLKNTFFSNSFQRIIWNKNNFNQKNVPSSSKRTIYDTSHGEKFFYVKGSVDNKRIYYKSFLDAILNNSVYRDNKSELRFVSLENLISYTLNSDFMEFSKRSFLGTLNTGRSAQIRENNKKIFVENGLKRALKYAMSDVGSKPTFLSIFHHLYFMYNNTENYSTSQNFNFDSISGNFNITNTSILNSMYNFSYVENVPFRNFLNNKLFPSFLPNEKKLPEYAYRYFLNRPVFSTSFYSTVPTPPPTSYINLRSKFIEDLYKNNTIINENKIVQKIGGTDIRNYFERAIFLAVQSIDNNIETKDLLNVINYDSFNLDGSEIKAVESLNTIRDAIIAHINLQTADTNQFINDVTLIYRTFLIDLIDSYFGFLTDPSKINFQYEVSDENLKVYKLLNFIKHIFISLYSFVILTKESKPLLDFYTSILSLKGLLTRLEIRELLNNSYSEIEQLFRR